MASQPKIVLLVNNFPPRVDGVGDYAFRLGSEFGERGLDVHVVCRRDPEAPPAPGPFTVHPVVSRWDRRGFAAALAKIRELNPDRVLLQYVPYGFDPYGMPFGVVGLIRRLRKDNIGVFAFLHEFFIGWRLRSVRALGVALAQFWITRSICRNAGVVATSNDHYLEVLSRWRSDVHRIPVGSNVGAVRRTSGTRSASRPTHAGRRLNATSVADRPAVAHGPVSVEPTEFTLVSFGVRDAAVLLGFFRVFRQRVPAARLVICGKQRRDEATAHPEGVTFTGYLPASEVVGQLAAADVFLLPDPVSAKGEGGTSLKSGSLAAAFAAGLPIVGTRGTMNDRVLREMPALQLVEYGDRNAWVEAVWSVYREPAQWESRRRESRRFYDENLSWRVIADRYLQLISRP